MRLIAARGPQIYTMRFHHHRIESDMTERQSGVRTVSVWLEERPSVRRNHTHTHTHLVGTARNHTPTSSMLSSGLFCSQDMQYTPTFTQVGIAQTPSQKSSPPCIRQETQPVVACSSPREKTAGISCSLHAAPAKVNHTSIKSLRDFFEPRCSDKAEGQVWSAKKKGGRRRHHLVALQYIMGIMPKEFDVFLTEHSTDVTFAFLSMSILSVLGNVGCPKCPNHLMAFGEGAGYHCRLFAISPLVLGTWKFLWYLPCRRDFSRCVCHFSWLSVC